jgi:nucleoporin NUP1
VLLIIAEAPQPVHQNDAERILYALESMRKTPLTEARTSTSSFGSMPPDLVGSSSRSLRKAISVPLATAQAGDTARQRREKDRLGDDYNVMISPYGRRKAVERDQRDQRLDRSHSEMDEGDYFIWNARHWSTADC